VRSTISGITVSVCTPLCARSTRARAPPGTDRGPGVRCPDYPGFPG